MTKAKALDQYYRLQSLAAELSKDKIRDVEHRARELAQDIALCYHITDAEISCGAGISTEKLRDWDDIAKHYEAV